MDQSEALSKLQQYRVLLEKHFAVSEMFLFGSFAKGEQHQHSDIDVAVVVNELTGDHLAQLALLWKLRRQVDDRIEPVLIESGHDPSGFLSEIQRQGIAVAA
jgi:predicted nucleotidyltransferase